MCQLVNRQKIYNWLKAIQYDCLPPICRLCGGRGLSCGLCTGCISELPWQPPSCTSCALPLAAGSLCGRCARSRPRHEQAVAIFEYAPPIDALIQRVKFNDDLCSARLLGMLMAEGIRRRGAALPELLIPVPLHPRRFAQRGYNQATELTRPIARMLRLPVDQTCCIRIRETVAQSGLSAAERRTNLQNAFAARYRAAGDVAIVDDVMTTGTTVDALVLALQRAGVERVRVWVCARASPHRG